MAAGNQPFSLQDAAAYPFTAGGVAQAAPVDIVGVKTIQQSMSVETVENRGDGAVLASVAEINSLELTITLAAFTPTSIAAISGGTVSTSGTGATAITKLSRKTTDVVPYFKLMGQTRAKDAEGGAARVTYPKVSWQGGPDFSFADNAFAEFAVNAKAIPGPADVLYDYEAFATWTAFPVV